VQTHGGGRSGIQMGTPVSAHLRINFGYWRAYKPSSAKLAWPDLKLPVRYRICLCANARRQAQTGYPGHHGYENTDWFFNMVLCVFMVKGVVCKQRHFY